MVHVRYVGYNVLITPISLNSTLYVISNNVVLYYYKNIYGDTIIERIFALDFIMSVQWRPQIHPSFHILVVIFLTKSIHTLSYSMHFHDSES